MLLARDLSDGSEKWSKSQFTKKQGRNPVINVKKI
jgi:hypothetical protein